MKNIGVEKNAQVFSAIVLMSKHTYNLRSTESIPSSISIEEVSATTGTSGSSSADTPPNQGLPAASLASPYFTGYIPIFRPIYIMADGGGEQQPADQLANADQINVIGGSLDDIDQLGGPMQDARFIRWNWTC